MNCRCGWLVPLTLLMLVLGACGEDVAPNEPPTLTLDVRSEETYVVGDDVILIQATATDPDGDGVSFEVVDKPVRAELQTFANSALFRWDPIASDVTGDTPRRLIFVATDSRGASAERVVNVNIRAGNGTPKFLNASSKLYDPDSGEPLAFDVEVRDDDSQDVELTMPAETAPAGASFTQTGPKSGEFSWDPSIEQRGVRVHSATFVADDGQSEPVVYEVTIIFQENGGGGTDPDPTQTCDADQPIVHAPLGAQRTLDDYQIEAAFSSAAAQKYDTAYVIWTTGDPLDNSDVDYDSRELEIDGTELRGAIPNLLLSAGESQTVFYSLCAVDQDAPETADDRFVCVPPNTYFSFAAYSPDESSCVDDAAAGDSFSSATTTPDSEWGDFHACSGAPDFHEITVSAGEVVEIFATYSKGQGVGIKLYDETQKPREAVATSDCYGIAYIQLEGPASGEQTWYLEVSGDDAPYQLTAWRDQQGGPQCGDEDLEPNDTVGEAVLVFEDDEQFSQMAICEQDDVDVYAWDMLAGDRVSVDVTFTHADGDIDASLFAPSQPDREVSPEGFGVAEGWSSDDDERFTHRAEESGIYHLAVFSSGEPNAYDLSISKTCGDNDAFGSSNHSMADAALFSPGDYPGLKACAGSADWYERTGFAGATVLAEVTVQQGARLSDVSFEVYDASGNRLESATLNNDRLDLAFEPPSRGQYFYKVSAPSSMIYDLTLFD